MSSRLFAAALCAVALVVGTARADEAAEREARALFAEANKKSDTGDLGGALEGFRGAHARWQNPKILLSIADVLTRLGRNAEAADSLAAYLRDAAADPAKRPEVEAALRALDAKVAKLHVIVDDRTATVRVDGKAVGKPGGVPEMRIEPGPHGISAEREGAPPAVSNVTAIAGQELSVTLHIATPAAAPTEPQSPSPPPVVSPAPPQPAAAPDAPTAPPPSLSHRGQFGAILRADIDGQLPGVVPALGLAYGAGDYIEVNACALVGKNSKGVEPGVTALLLRGAWKPRLSVGVPIFFTGGVHPGIHAGAGVQWDPIRHFGVFVDAGVAVFPNAQDGYQKVVFLPSIGVEPRL